MRIFNFSPERVNWIWQKLEGSKGFWRENEGFSKEGLSQALQRSDLLFDLEFGIGRITRMEQGSSCRVHGLFWSKEVFKRTDELKAMLQAIGSSFHLDRIECVIPSETRSLSRLLRKLGFEYEGTLRRYYRIDSGFRDGDLFSLIGGFHG